MNDSIRYVTTPRGEELAILPRAQLEELLDVAGHASAMADYRSGRVEALTTSEMRELMKAPTPLAFWRRRRGVTQAALAGLAETTQPHIAELESGRRGGSLDVMARIGRALKVPLEALA
jgi:DNA-binding XRE family transcriptional regulator